MNISEKHKKLALAKIDTLRLWEEFRKSSQNKVKADYEFVQMFHSGSNKYLFEIVGKISRGGLHRWKQKLNNTDNYTLLIPNYRYSKHAVGGLFNSGNNG